jgi:hypothetical protein
VKISICIFFYIEGIWNFRFFLAIFPDISIFVGLKPMGSMKKEKKDYQIIPDFISLSVFFGRTLRD